MIISLTLLPFSTPAAGTVLLGDNFNGSAGSELDPAKWSIYLDPYQGGGGAVYQTGDGWAKIDPAGQHTGSGFTSIANFTNAGTYTVSARAKFDQGGWADGIFVLIRNPDEAPGREGNYLHYQGAKLLYRIHTGWHTDPYALSSVIIQTFQDIDTYDAPAWGDPPKEWAATNNIVDILINYNADTGFTSFTVSDPDTGQTLTEASTTVSSDVRSAIGANFKVEIGMDGYNAVPDYWDFVEVTPEPATLALVAVGIGGLMVRRRRG